MPEICRWAGQLGLDFLLFSDHHTLQPKHDGLEKFYGNVIALIGYETSDNLDRNHYMVFDTDEVTKGLSTPEYVKTVQEAGGIGIIAHPIEKRDSIPEFPPYPWTNWDLNGFNGVEIWNQLSEWTERLTPANKLWKFMHPLKTLVAPPSEVLQKWDEIAQKRKIIGTVGVDAHCFQVWILNLIKVHIFHYKVTFRSLRNHLLLNEPFPRGDFGRAKNLLYDALRNARLFCSNPRRGDARGFRFYSENDDGYFTIGESIPAGDNVFKIKSPLNAELRLLRNGERVAAGNGNYLEHRSIQPGVYRVEARRQGKAWVFTNHIYVEGN